ncbi:hypothetical protein CMI37_09585 [Candidatus Pacearchaeota archaeon]|nr:hypothetical protein [Candidatus Pacearchaeota archaeon]
MPKVSTGRKVSRRRQRSKPGGKDEVRASKAPELFAAMFEGNARKVFEEAEHLSSAETLMLCRQTLIALVVDETEVLKKMLDPKLKKKEYEALERYHKRLQQSRMKSLCDSLATVVKIGEQLGLEKGPRTAKFEGVKSSRPLLTQAA